MQMRVKTSTDKEEYIVLSSLVNQWQYDILLKLSIVQAANGKNNILIIMLHHKV